MSALNQLDLLTDNIGKLNLWFLNIDLVRTKFGLSCYSISGNPSFFRGLQKAVSTNSQPRACINVCGCWHAQVHSRCYRTRTHDMMRSCTAEFQPFAISFPQSHKALLLSVQHADKRKFARRVFVYELKTPGHAVLALPCPNRVSSQGRLVRPFPQQD